MKVFRRLLFPLGLLYGLIVAIRNWSYLNFPNKRFKVPAKSIVIGNLSVGGTGKTPHVAYLLELLLSKEIKTQVISRGYGRKTKGFFEVTESDLSENVGDEPLLLKKRFPKAQVAVSEKRAEGIVKTIPNNPEVYLFDDAYQHLAIQAEKYILLTTFDQPYFSDLVLPSGNLREFKCGKKRADFVIVTKTPKNITLTQKEKFKNQLNIGQTPVYFSTIKYDKLKGLNSTDLEEFDQIILVSGIANPKLLVEHLSSLAPVELIQFADHHNFVLEDLNQIHKKFDIFAQNCRPIIVTTEKDFVRLKDPKFSNVLQNYPWYYQPITIEIDEEQEFKNKILAYVRAI